MHVVVLVNSQNWFCENERTHLSCSCKPFLFLCLKELVAHETEPLSCVGGGRVKVLFKACD
jgi:hypothetical protein